MLDIGRVNDVLRLLQTATKTLDESQRALSDAEQLLDERQAVHDDLQTMILQSKLAIRQTRERIAALRAELDS